MDGRRVRVSRAEKLRGELRGGATLYSVLRMISMLVSFSMSSISMHSPKYCPSGVSTRTVWKSSFASSMLTIAFISVKTPSGWHFSSKSASSRSFPLPSSTSVMLSIM